MFKFKFEHPPLIEEMLKRKLREGLPPKRFELEPKVRPMEAGRMRLPSLLKGL